ncbi:MAG: hypothetical protein GWP04_12070 [Gammaproteobacteria bacterium]|nr:hypothetical protein [Gammaproteobacteria bacterium]
MKRATLAVVLSVLVLVLVLTVVLVFGVIPFPEYPSLAEQPDPSIPGTVVFTRGDDPPCLEVVPAGGGVPRELRCDRDVVGNGLAWTSDGLIVTFDASTYPPQYALIDPESGQVVERFDAGLEGPEPLFPNPETSRRADGAVLTAGQSAGGATLMIKEPNKESRLLLEVSGPRNYRFDIVRWSPDGNWALVIDSEERLLILRATGDPEPRVLVKGVARWMSAAWYIPGFDGFEVPGR